MDLPGSGIFLPTLCSRLCFDSQPTTLTDTERAAVPVGRRLNCCVQLEAPFILNTDASDVDLGAVLSQDEEQGERVVAHFSRLLNCPERNYGVT